jgi:tetratricopeptide (TPR) repeat protein
MSGTTGRNLWQRLAGALLTRALIVYLGVSFAVLQTVDIFTEQLGLPDWVFPGTLILLGLGLPVVVATGVVHWLTTRVGGRAPEAAAAAGAAKAESGATTDSAARRPWLSWRKALVGGVVAFGLWGILIAGYMSSRALGIGPVGSLVAAGVLDEREPVILADFENSSPDPLLGRATTEAFRIDLGQSSVVTVVSTAYVGRVLALMQRDPAQPLDEELAREVAIREGIKAVVGGDITPVGSGYVLAARLVAAQDGQVLAATRETAADSTEVIEAIDRLSKKLRERIGESLKIIRRGEPLDQVTTPSLEALRKYSLALRVLDQGENERAIALLEEAVALDTAFAMAYRKLGVTLGNIGLDPDRGVWALTQAYEHRERLTDRERYLTLGSYYTRVTMERDKAITAYGSALDINPDDPWALNNLGLLYYEQRDWRRARQLFERAAEIDSTGSLYYLNLTEVQVALGQYDEAEATLGRLAERFPAHYSAAELGASLAASQFDYATAETYVSALGERVASSPSLQLVHGVLQASLAEVQGRLRDAERSMEAALAIAEQQGNGAVYINTGIRIAFYDLLFRGQRDRALRRVAAALERYPLASLSRLQRPYGTLVLFYALAGEAGRARATLAQFEAEVEPTWRDSEGEADLARGAVALAENRSADATDYFRRADVSPCPICTLPLLSMAYDAAGQPDSVIAVGERYLTTPWLGRLPGTDWYALAPTLERLGGLYELRGEREKALSAYRRFAELWRYADPELQPRVQAAQRAIERLAGETDAG